MNRFPRVSRVRRILAACVLAALLVAGQAMATDRYVATNGTGGDGTNWTTALTNIQTALNAAANSDRIYLAGQLFPLTNQLTWVNNTNVTIRGGYAATNDAGLPGPYDSRLWPTILVRIGATNCSIMSITNVAAGLLERVAFTGGRVKEPSQKGGGLYILNSTNLVISACSITNNAVSHPGDNTYAYGGGIYSESSFVTVSNCLIRGNSTITKAGGLSYGGGIYIKNGTMLLQDSILGNNLADSAYTYTHFGGGLYNDGGTCVLRNCLVVGNAVGNVGYQSASAAGIHAKGDTRLENCTVTDNAGVGIYQQSGTVTVTNSVVWGNVDDLVGTVTLGWSDIEDGDNNETNGNISANPRFEYGYYLATNSPCVGTGTNLASILYLTNYTTRTDGLLDTNANVTMGYHYPAGYDSSHGDFYVATNGADTGKSGTNWAEAFRTITKALSVAQDGTRIHLASGNYTNGSETFPLTVPSLNGLKILGTNRTTTVINAAGATQQVMVVTNCAGLTMAEVTLTGGSRTMLSLSYGGGVFLRACGGVKLSGCVITNNSLSGAVNVNIYGGGLYSIASSITLSNCLIKGNTAFTPSGSCYAYGGGIFLKGGMMMARDSVIANNVALRTESGLQLGGGIYSDGGSCVLRNCLVVGNAVGTAGTGAGLSQGGSYSVMRIENCTVADNSGEGLNRSNGDVGVTNSIFWGNGDDLASSVTLAYSDVQTADSFWTNGVNGNLSSDPLFDRGYYLATNSPCVGKGTNLASILYLTNYTTRTDGLLDTNANVTMGYHYATGMNLTVADLYVSVNGTNTSSGTNWAEAFRTITKALSVAQDGTRIHIGPGNYTNGLETFPLTVTYLNGLQLLGTNRTTTVINAAGATQRVMTVNNCANLTVSEITFTGGYLAETTATPIYGGGVYLSACGGLVMSGCLISSNTVYTSAGNGYVYGGGLYSINSSVTLSNCLVTSNSAICGASYVASGGGIYQSAGTLSLLNSILTGNTARRGTTLGAGGGINNNLGSCALRNCLVARNVVLTTGEGGGLYLNGNTSLENCTVVNNTNQGIYQVGGTVAVTNSIFWGNGVDVAGAVTLGWSCSGNGVTGGVNGCISADPLFVNAALGDYHLTNSSPCVNAGTNQAWMVGAWDLDGSVHKRIRYRMVDMGAYEALPPKATMFGIH